MIKVALVMAGGGAAGKTTVTQAFAIGDAIEYTEYKIVPTRKGMREMKCSWTVYDNCAVAGNNKSGTDANTGPGVTKAALYEALYYSNVAIVDGMVSSPKWAVMCNDWQEDNPNDRLIVLLLHFDLSSEDLLDRLANRRGTDKETFRERMEPRCKQLVRRAELLVEHFDSLCTVPVRKVVVDRYASPDDIVMELDYMLCEIFEDCYD